MPREKTQEVIERIETTAQSVGFLQEIKGKKYVSLEGSGTKSPAKNTNNDSTSELSSDDTN